MVLIVSESGALCSTTTAAATMTAKTANSPNLPFDHFTPPSRLPRAQDSMKKGHSIADMRRRLPDRAEQVIRQRVSGLWRRLEATAGQ